MDVQLKEHVGTHAATKRPTKHAQYKVFVDGRWVGVIGWDANSKLCLFERFGPMEKVEIELRVGWHLGHEVKSVSVPDVPPEMQKQPQDEDIYGNELDA